MSSEILSALHEAVRRGQLGTGQAPEARVVFDGLPVRFEDSRRLGEEAWRIQRLPDARCGFSCSPSE